MGFNTQVDTNQDIIEITISKNKHYMVVEHLNSDIQKLKILLID
jgi:hypothetical protein